jgi:hypothetical protein
LSHFPSRPLHGGPCCVCRRRDDGLAVARGRAFHWTCEAHVPLAKRIASMPRKKLDNFEQKALRAAGDQAGAYLDSIGKTDLATLDEVQWVAFLRKVVDGFGDALEAELSSDEAPF